MAQGVAREQENQGGKVKVDGMAGPRTLPRLFPTGLATEKSARTFVAEGDAFAKAWDALGTPEKRAEDLVKRIQPLLGEVPTITPKADTIADGSVGKFQAKAWTMLVGKSLLTGPAPDEARTERITSTIYHEARHAEQHFAMARARATQLRGGSTDVVAGLEKEMEIPHAIAEKAAAAPPMPPGVEFATAVQQYESVYGAGRAKHKAIEEAAPTTEQLEQARKAAATDPTPANKAEHARLLAAFRAYHDLPTENNAFATESDFELAWDTAHAPPPPGP